MHSSHEMTPKIEDLVERHCKKNPEKGNFLKWLSDNGYKGIETQNELIPKIQSIIKDYAPDENLVKQNVSDYLNDFFLDLSEGDIQSLNLIISSLEMDNAHDIPSLCRGVICDSSS